MRLLKWYTWCAGSQHDFTRHFQDNDQLLGQARLFWNSLDGCVWIVMTFAVVFGIGTGAYYYTAYNNVPGRHYKPSKWFLFLILTFAITLIVSYGFQYVMCMPRLNGASKLEFMVSVGNSVYCCLAYFITSVIWCNLLPTNAYRFFKI